MPDKDKNSDKSPKKKNESASATPAAGSVEDSKGKEKNQLEGNDPAAVNEAAKRAEMAVSDAEKEVARTIEAMKSQVAGDDH
jgi:ABC-type transporter Mla subunit MlaD